MSATPVQPVPAVSSLYPEDFPAGELSGSCVLIKKAEITQEGNNVVLTLRRR